MLSRAHPPTAGRGRLFAAWPAGGDGTHMLVKSVTRWVSLRQERASGTRARCCAAGYKATGGGELSSQKPCVTPREIGGDVSSDHIATAGGCARKRGAASAECALSTLRPGTWVSSSSAKDATEAWGKVRAHCQPTWIFTYCTPWPYAFPAGWHSATV